MVPVAVALLVAHVAAITPQESWVSPELDSSDGMELLGPGAQRVKAIRPVPSGVELSLNTLGGLKEMNNRILHQLNEGPSLRVLRARESRQKRYVKEVKSTMEDVQEKQRRATGALSDRRKEEYTNQDSRYHRNKRFLSDDPEDEIRTPKDESKIPVDCVVEEWGDWSKCDASHSMTRSRGVLRSPKNGGWGCSKLVDRRHCANCRVGEWMPWSPCSMQNVGHGSHKVDKTTRKRVILELPVGGGEPCPSAREERHCKDVPSVSQKIEIRPKQKGAYANVSQDHGLNRFNPAKLRPVEAVDADQIQPGADASGAASTDSGTVAPAVTFNTSTLSAMTRTDQHQVDKISNEGLKHIATVNRLSSKSGAVADSAGPSNFDSCQDRYARWCKLNHEPEACRDPLFAHRCVKTCGHCHTSNVTKYSRLGQNLIVQSHHKLQKLQKGEKLQELMKPSKSSQKQLYKHMRESTVKELTVRQCKPTGEQPFWGKRAETAKSLRPTKVGIVTPMFGSPDESGAWDEVRGKALLASLKGKIVYSKYNQENDPSKHQDQLFFLEHLRPDQSTKSPDYQAEIDDGTRHCLRRVDLNTGGVAKYHCYAPSEHLSATSMVKPSSMLLAGANWLDKFSGFYTTKLYSLEILHTHGQHHAVFHIMEDHNGKPSNKTQMVQISDRMSQVLKPSSNVTSFSVSYPGHGPENVYMAVNHQGKAVVYMLSLDACTLTSQGGTCSPSFHPLVESPDMKIASFAVEPRTSKLFIADSLHNSILEAGFGQFSSDRYLTTLIGTCDIRIAKMIRNRCANTLGSYANAQEKMDCCIASSTALKSGHRNHCCRPGTSVDAYGMHSAQVDFRSGEADMMIQDDPQTGESYLYVAETSGQRIRRVALTATNPNVEVVANMVKPTAIAAAEEDLYVFDAGSHIARVNIETKVPCGEMLGYARKSFAEWVGGRKVEELCLKLEHDPEGMFFPWVAIRKKNPEMREICLKPVVSPGSPSPKEVCCGEKTSGDRVADFKVQIVPDKKAEPTKSMQVSGTVEQQKSKAMVEADAERKKGVSPETMLKKSRDAMHAAVTMMRAAKQSDTNVLKQEISQIVSKDTQKEATKEVEKAKEAMKNLAFDSQAEEKKIIERNEEVEHKKPIEQTNAALNQLTKVLRPETPNNNHVMIKESQVKADIRNREESRTAPTDCERRGHHIAAIDRVDCYLRKALVPDANLVKETQTKLDQSRIDKLVSKVKLEVSKLHSGKVAAIVKDAQEQLQRLRVHSHNVMDRTNIKKALTALDHLRNIEKQQVDAVEINSDRKALEKQSAIAAARAEVFANEAMKIQAQQNSSMMEVQSLEDSDKVMPVMKSNVTHSKEVQNFDDKDVVTEEAVPTAIEEHLTQAQRVNQLERQKETKAEGARQLATNVSIANATQPD